MNARSIVIAAALICATGAARAQMPHQSEESKMRNKARAEYSAFKHQILALKEFADEKRKVQRLQKENNAMVKIVATIDSVDNDEVKTLTGYITEQIGDNSVNAYEVTFDRASKTIISVKKTGEAEEPEATEKAQPKKGTPAAAPKAKKKGDDDDDDGDDDDSKTPKKDKDDD